MNKFSEYASDAFLLLLVKHESHNYNCGSGLRFAGGVCSGTQGDESPGTEQQAYYSKAASRFSDDGACPCPTSAWFPMQTSIWTKAHRRLRRLYGSPRCRTAERSASCRRPKCLVN